MANNQNDIHTLNELIGKLENEQLALERTIEDCKRENEILKLKRDIAPLIRPEVAGEFLGLFNDDFEMLTMISKMMSIYDKTRSIEQSDKVGAQISDNSNHGIAKQYVAYFYKNGMDYLFDWHNQFKKTDASKKQQLYDDFIQRCQPKTYESKIR